MNRSSLSVLAKALAGKNNMPLADAELFIKQMFDVANNVLQADKQLKIRWLGTFKVMAVKDRESVDVNTGERIIIGGRDKISFTPDNILKEIVNKPFAQFETVVVNDGVDFSEIDNKFSEKNMSVTVKETSVSQTEGSSVSIKEDSVSTKEGSVSAEEKDKGLKDIQHVPEKAVGADDVRSKEKVEADVVKNEDKDSLDSKVVQDAPQDALKDATISSCKIVQHSENEEIKDDETNTKDNEQKEDVDQELMTATVEPQMVEDIPQGSSSDKKVDSIDTEESGNGRVAEVINKDQKHEETTTSNKQRYMVLPRYAIVIALIVVLALIGGIGWLAFNYGKMAAQRNHLEMQLADIQKKKQLSIDSVKIAEQQKTMSGKAAEDSIRMLKASKAIEMNSTETEDSKLKKDSIKSEHQHGDQKEKFAQYDKDPRVRTGAYRIIGIDKSITVKNGQTLESLSKLYLGPGMECYMEAVNGTTEIKAGQIIKIPRLELKRKR